MSLAENICTEIFGQSERKSRSRNRTFFKNKETWAECGAVGAPCLRLRSMFAHDLVDGENRGLLGGLGEQAGRKSRP